MVKEKFKAPKKSNISYKDLEKYTKQLSTEKENFLLVFGTQKQMIEMLKTQIADYRKQLGLVPLLSINDKIPGYIT